MSWIAIALSAYLFLAIANLLDKFLIDEVLPSSKAYAFIACFFAGLALLAAPWLLEWPGFYWLFINLLSGAIFAVALYSLYEALRRGEASKVLVFIGGLTPIFTIVFSILFLKEQYSSSEYLGSSLLILGTGIVAFLPEKRNWLARLMNKIKFKQKIKKDYLLFAFISALSYSAYFLLTKYSYSTQKFESVFLWNRLGAVLFVLIFLFNVKDRKDITSIFKRRKKGKRKISHKLLVIVGQAFGSLGFVLQNYAIFLGSVALVNALQGAQYAFILVVSTILAVLSPKLLKETFSWKNFLMKLTAVLIIAAGLYFIVI